MNEDSSNSLPHAGRLERVVSPGTIWTDGSVEEPSKITQRIQDWRKTLEGIAPSSPTADNIQQLRLAFAEHLQRSRVPADELTVEDINAEAEFARWLYPLIRSVGRRLGFSALECKTLLSEGAAERSSLWDDLRERAAERATQPAQQFGETAAEDHTPGDTAATLVTVKILACYAGVTIEAVKRHIKGVQAIPGYSNQEKKYRYRDVLPALKNWSSTTRNRQTQGIQWPEDPAKLSDPTKLPSKLPARGKPRKTR